MSGAASAARQPLARAAADRPHAVAVADDSASLTFEQLVAAATGLAGALRASGLRDGDRVLLLADGAPAVVGIHGTWAAGAVLVAANHRLPDAVLADQARRARVRAVAADAALAPRGAAIAGALGSVPLLDVAADARQARPDAPPAAHAPPAGDATPAAIVFTSGTTGEPRAAVLTHGNLRASATAWNTFLGAGPDDRWLATLPLFHVAGLGVVVRAALAGSRITIQARFDPERVLSALRDGVAFVSLVPTQLARLLDVASGTIRGPALRALLLGGAPIPPALVVRAIDAGLPVVPTYGLTEASSGVTALPAEEARAHPASSGRPLPGLELRIAHAGDKTVPAGTEGEIHVAGPTVFAGYDDDPEATGRALAGGWLRTGDIGRLDADGRLTVLERRDDLVVTGGENVYPAQVEQVLLGHPGIADAAVTGRPDRRWGAVPVAAIVARADHEPDAAADAGLVRLLDRHARERLAGYAVPVAWHLTDELPRTMSGKLRRADVRDLVERGPAIEQIGRPDGARIRVRRRGSGPPLVLLHATLSTAAELDPLARFLADRFLVLAVDRRSAGASDPGRADGLEPLDVGVHVADLLATLDALGIDEPVTLVGHSYGGCLALEVAARSPGRVSAVWAWEPPYVPAGPPELRARFAALGTTIREVAGADGPGAAGLAFLAALLGDDAVARLPAFARDAVLAEGRSAVADAALRGLDLDGLTRIACPTTIASGGRSDPFYAAIATGLAARIPHLRRAELPELSHAAPVRRPETVAAAILGALPAVDPHDPLDQPGDPAR